MPEVNQKRIATNTILLYARMVVVMFVSLYTSRVVIDALGQTYFGIYDAVGGIVMMASFISSTMSSACQRWYSFEMVGNNPERIQRIFSISLTIFLVLAMILGIVCEAGGMWWLTHKMDVAGHLEPAKWVFHFSVLAFLIQIIRLPYQGMVISKEKMKVFAYLSLFEAFATLGIALIIKNTRDDKDFKLILYAGLIMGIQLMTSLFYWTYCRLFYKECRYRFVLDREKFREMFAFAGWNMIGSFADVCKSYGITLLLNSCFGTIVSAARGIGNKVYNTIISFNSNFFTAVRPQLIKSYAAGELDDMRKLICQSTKFSFFVMFILALPIICEIDFILPLWIRGRNVPDEAYLITKLMVIEGLVNCMTSPFAASIQATGNIKKYQIAVGLNLLLIIPTAYLGIKYLNMDAAMVFVVSIAVTIGTHIIRLFFLKKQIGLDILDFTKRVLWPIILVTIISTALTHLVKFGLRSCYGNDSIIKSLAVIASSLVITAVTSFFIGMSKTERRHILEIAVKLLKSKQQ